MLEVLKLIIELCQKAAGFAETRKKQLSIEVGQEFLVLYLRINDVVHSAHGFITKIERFVDCVEFRMANWNEDCSRAADICQIKEAARTLSEHGVLVRNLVHQLVEIDAQFSILDEETRRQLRGLLGIKISALRHVLAILQSARWIALENGDEFLNRYGADPSQETFLQAFQGTPIDFTHSPDLQYKLLRQYLDSSGPRRRVEELDSLRATVKEMVEKYWEIPDLLPGLDLRKK